MSSKFAVWIDGSDATGDIYVWKCTSCGYVVTPEEGSPMENGMDCCPGCGAKMMGEMSE